MEGRTLEIELPLPAKALSPNARVHWSALASAKKAARMDANIATQCACNNSGQEWDQLAKATMQATFYHATKANRDDDNLNASLKAYRDGIADSGLVANDRDITSLPPIQLIDKQNPRLVVTIREVLP